MCRHPIASLQVPAGEEGGRGGMPNLRMEEEKEGEEEYADEFILIKTVSHNL